MNEPTDESLPPERVESTSSTSNAPGEADRSVPEAAGKQARKQILDEFSPLRADIARLGKPRYDRPGRPTRAEVERKGYLMTRDEWYAAWMRSGGQWGGRRKGGVGQRRGITRVQRTVMLSLDIAERLDKMPRRSKSNYINKALELLIMMEPPETIQGKRRGRHAHTQPVKQTRRVRMSRIEKAKADLAKTRAAIAKLKEEKQAAQENHLKTD